MNSLSDPFCRAKCKKYDQQSSIEEILQELERPVTEDAAQPATDTNGAGAMVQRTPSLVRVLSIHACLLSYLEHESC